MAITFTWESFEVAYPGVADLLVRRHYEEMAANKHFYGLPDVDVARYLALEKAGALHILMVRDDGKAIGYFVDLIHTNMHYQTVKMATEDTYYLDPAYRGKGIGKRMFREIERVAEFGARMQVVKTRDAHDNGPFLESLGYRPADRLYMKILRGK